MNISNPQDSNTGNTNYTPKELYLGKAGYQIIAVNPDKEQLKLLNQYVPENEPEYTFMREIDGKQHRGVNIKVYLRNIKDYEKVDTVTYSIIDDVQVSATGKLAVINKYGTDTWLEQSALDSKTMPDNMSWYLNEGVKPAMRGEKELIGFIRALMNFKKISDKSTEKEKTDYVSVFDDKDLDKMLSGNYADIKKVLMSNTDLKIGFVLGVRKNEENKTYQDLYKEYPLRSFMVDNAGSNEYIVKDITEAQTNGKYKNTYFDVNDLSYKKYNTTDGPQADTANTFTSMANAFPENDLPF